MEAFFPLGLDIKVSTDSSEGVMTSSLLTISNVTSEMSVRCQVVQDTEESHSSETVTITTLGIHFL